MESTIIVSIVIPTYNSSNKLIRSIQSIEGIDFPVKYYEVIVVDDGSSDGTGAHVVELVKRTKINLLYLHQENKGPAAARNYGIRQAQGEYVLIIDSDCIVDSNILNRYLQHFPDSRLGGVGGNVLPESINIISKYLDHNGVWRPGYANGDIMYLVTANAFFVKEAIVRAGYFDEDFRWPGGEEPELCFRMRKNGYYFKYDETAAVTHSHRTTIRGMVRMFYCHGRGHALFVSKWPNESYSFEKLTSELLPKQYPIRALTYFVLYYISRHASHIGYCSMQSNYGTIVKQVIYRYLKRNSLKT